MRKKFELMSFGENLWASQLHFTIHIKKLRLEICFILKVTCSIQNTSNLNEVFNEILTSQTLQSIQNNNKYKYTR